MSRWWDDFLTGLGWAIGFGGGLLVLAVWGVWVALTGGDE